MYVHRLRALLLLVLPSKSVFGSCTAYEMCSLNMLNIDSRIGRRNSLTDASSMYTDNSKLDNGCASRAQLGAGKGRGERGCTRTLALGPRAACQGVIACGRPLQIKNITEHIREHESYTRTVVAKNQNHT